jgi:hypothetical protein
MSDHQPNDFFSKVSQNQSIFYTVEKIPTKVFRTPTEACSIVATVIANTIKEKQSMDEDFVMGLAVSNFFPKNPTRFHLLPSLCRASKKTPRRGPELQELPRVCCA